jgi:serine/threonine protein kinase
MMEYSVSDTCFDLMSKMLSFDNDTRINAKEALLHPYFKESQRPSAKKPFNIL